MGLEEERVLLVNRRVLGCCEPRAHLTGPQEWATPAFRHAGSRT